MFNKKKTLSSVITSLMCILAMISAVCLSSCSNNTYPETNYTTAVTTTKAAFTLPPTTAESITEEPTTAKLTTAAPTTQKPTVKATKRPTEKPTEPQESTEVTYLTSSVSPGEYAGISICGTPNTDYSITVTYNSGASTAAGLYTKTSDSNGNVSWEWKVGTRTASGTYPIRISGGGQTITEYFTVI